MFTAAALPLNFTWTCAASDGSACYTATTQSLLTLAYHPIVAFSSLNLLPGSYTFAVVVSKGTRTAPALSTLIQIASAAVPVVALGVTPTLINPNAMLVITSSSAAAGGVAQAQDPMLRYQWVVRAYHAKSSNQACARVCACMYLCVCVCVCVCVKEFDHSVKCASVHACVWIQQVIDHPEMTLSSVASNGVTTAPNLVLNTGMASVFAIGQQYVFALTVTDMDGQTNTAQTSPVLVNGPPTNGVLSVSPTNGTALVTTFTLQTSSWETGSGSGLMFEFSRVIPASSSGGTATLVLLSPRSAATSFTTSSLPSGLASSNYTLTLNVRAIDSLGAYSDTTMSIEVMPLVAAGSSSAAGASLFSSVLSALTTTATNNDQTSTFVSALGAMADSLNTGAFGGGTSTTSSSASTSVVNTNVSSAATAANAQVVQMKQQLLAQIASVSASAAIPPVILQSNLASLVQVPSQVSLSLAASTLSLVWFGGGGG
jgi:hypothetical protein